VALVPQADFSTNCRVLAVWCEQFAANFGDVTITPAAKKAPPAAPRATTGAATPACANGGFSGFEGDLSTLEHQVRGEHGRAAPRIGGKCSYQTNARRSDGWELRSMAAISSAPASLRQVAIDVCRARRRSP
jgi:hypothetical protein